MIFVMVPAGILFVPVCHSFCLFIFLFFDFRLKSQGWKEEFSSLNLRRRGSLIYLFVLAAVILCFDKLERCLDTLYVFK